MTTSTSCLRSSRHANEW